MSPYDESGPLFHKAINDFHDARRKAALEGILSRFSGKSNVLLDYDLVRRKLNAIESASRRLEVIPLSKIVGSVNRYTDFTRTFLPRQESDIQRWTQVRLGVENMSGLPPIEAYKVDDVYFVLDGHHRVSVAREIGSDSIEGYVIPVQTRVPLSPGDSPDDLILKAEYTDFLNKTHIDELHPEANLLVTAPGQYPRLTEHINVHRYFMGEKRGQPVEDAEAISDWYDTVYQPIVGLIRERNLLRDFPARTETDLYLWIMDHRHALGGGELGWEVSPETAASDLLRRFSRGQRAQRVANRIADLLVPDPLLSGPPAGQWRTTHQSPRRGDHMFDDMMVTVPGSASHTRGWQAVDLAIEIARREEARLTGFHVVASDADRDTAEVQAISDEFKKRCGEAGIASRLVVETGNIAQRVCQRSPWVDLVVFRLNFPPPSKPIARLRSGARLLIRRCSSPLLALPDAHASLGSALLAYGPGPKADEALFVATYLAARWKIPLTVVTVRRPLPGKLNDGLPGASVDALQSPIERARRYLENHGVEASYIEETGDLARDPARAVLINAEAQSADFIIMGGYESAPLREAVFGSTVDRVLRSTRRPVLICR